MLSPDIPLHTNSAENAIRCQVTKRKISGGTRSDRGRHCRDAFLGLAKTCAKLGLTFWHYLGARLGCIDPGSVPNLPQLVRARRSRAPNRPDFCPYYAEWFSMLVLYRIFVAHILSQ